MERVEGRDAAGDPRRSPWAGSGESQIVEILFAGVVGILGFVVQGIQSAGEPNQTNPAAEIGCSGEGSAGGIGGPAGGTDPQNRFGLDIGSRVVVGLGPIATWWSYSHIVRDGVES